MTPEIHTSVRHPHTAVAVLPDRDALVSAVRELHARGFESDQLSILAKDDGELAATTRELGAKDGCEADPPRALAQDAEPKGRDEIGGMAVGGTVGFLIGLTAIALPGFGAFLLAAGPLAILSNALIVSAGGLGLGALLGAILDEKVTEEHRDLYERELRNGRWLLVVHGDETAIGNATALLRAHRPHHLDAF